MFKRKNISLLEKTKEELTNYTAESETAIDKFLGIDTVGFYFPKKDHTLYSSSIPYQTWPYPQISKLILFLKTRPEIINKNTILGGIGIGKGRLEFSIAAEIYLKKIIGMEAIGKLAHCATENFKNLKIKKNPDLECEIMITDAITTIRPEIDTYIMYKPFKHNALFKWLDNLFEKSFKDFHIIYIQEPQIDNNIKYFEKTPWLKSERIPGTDIWIFKSDLTALQNH